MPLVAKAFLEFEYGFVAGFLYVFGFDHQRAAAQIHGGGCVLVVDSKESDVLRREAREFRLLCHCLDSLI
ncbi:hypothetical protein [Microviridae sp.]|nr:hypothetical protein [Microviridae sp.]UOF81755.1 hypothetical protein [Microviridae sp.]